MKPDLPPHSFIGNFLMNIDQKNRVVIPPLFRDILNTHYADDNNTVIITISMEKTIAVYPMSSFDKFIEKLMEKPQLKSKVRGLTNAVSMSSTPQKIDRAGKIALNNFLMTKAGLKKEVYVVGCVDHFEIWAKERFEEYIDTYIQMITALGDTIE
ncbi:hypothetical protein J7M23_11125 [Candidatus Sumerlaeota bacterium]|nr:hypothetical protein [Candidatus Sumerlaeota bacterium]